MNVINLFKRIAFLAIILLVTAFLLGAGRESDDDMDVRVRVYTRDKEFNFIHWGLKAIGLKIGQAALNSQNYLNAEKRHQVVLDYLNLVREIQIGEGKLQDIYSDPNIADPETSSEELRQQLADLRLKRDQIDPLAEGILQDQVSSVASEMDLALGGQPIPPVLYHSSTLPWGLVISPRDTIRQESFVPLTPGLTLDQHVALEEQVDKALGVSSLVEGIGGLGFYPTMVDETSNLIWLSEVIAHEWIHNWMTLRPLGAIYATDPAIRTMNETTASIAGKEIGRAVIEKYYPELLPEPAPEHPELPEPMKPVEVKLPEFNFVTEMRKTRVETDRLLAEGKIDEAEQYMEAQRKVFWEHGYRIRKLNQAWFAFHGAYADDPGGGAAGIDPVGPAVRALRAQSSSLAEFLRRIAWMTSFEQLQRAVQNGQDK